MECAANVFIEPLGIPLKVFLLVLGPCKILGVLSLLGIGRGVWNPMPKWFAQIGLSLSATCAGIGHYKCGDSYTAAVVIQLAMMALFYSEYSEAKEKNVKVS